MSSTFRSGSSLGNAQDMARAEGGRQRTYAVWTLILGLCCGALYVVFDVNPIPVFAIFGALVVVMTLVMRPTMMLPFTLIGTCLIELQDNLNFHMSFTDRIPLFWNTNTIVQQYGGLEEFHFLPLSPFEILIILAFASWLIKSIADRNLKVRAGSLMAPIAAYFGFVLLGVINGQINGATLNIELFEVRAQVYFLFGYLMAINGDSEPRAQVRRMLWLIAVCIAFKAVFAMVRYFVEQGGHTVADVGIGSHEESFFFDAFIVQLLVLWLANIEPKLRIFMLVFLPIVLWMDLANQRRAATAALIICMPVLFTLAYFGFPARRKIILSVVAVLSAMTAVYLPMFWNSDATIAQPARAIRSQFTPDARDQSSNAYRDQEDANLFYTMKESPLIGYGYGRPFEMVVPMVDLTATDPLIHFIPHDQILWVWMRVGTIGFVVFWIMFSVILICCTQVAREPGYYPDIRATGVYAATLVVMLLIFGLLDMQLSNIRDMLFVSIWVGNLAYLRSYYLPVKTDDADPPPLVWPSAKPPPRVRVTEFGDQGPAR